MTTNPTGRRETRNGRDSVVYERTFRAPIESVWAAVTESARLERWIGRWTGDPSSGSVLFQMTAEGDDIPAEPFLIRACEPPRLLQLSSPDSDGGPDYELLLELSEEAGVTTLTFSQGVPNPEMASHVGPGWEYYLDRLVAAEDGADVGAISFDDYYPAQSDYFSGLFR